MRSTVLRTCVALKLSSVTFYDSIGDVTWADIGNDYFTSPCDQAPWPGPMVTAPQFIRADRTAGR
ncbi:hypothetical protein ACPCA8_35350 [Streptomyces capoamus]|uniref:hypothetical protein n=1 Tax=Streptomyces capoamus TaxID=68183 RepID=UPI003C2B76FF